MKTALEKINEAIYNWFESDAKSIHYNPSYLLEKINQIAKENSQPFSPELIVKMFEGWNYHQGLEYLLDRDQDVMISLFYCKDYNSVIVGKNHNSKDSFCCDAPMPRTLDEFITLCQQTKIELKERN